MRILQRSRHSIDRFSIERTLQKTLQKRVERVYHDAHIDLRKWIMSNIPVTTKIVNQIKVFLKDTISQDPHSLNSAEVFNGDWTLEGETLKYKGKIVVPKEGVESTLQRLTAIHSTYNKLVYDFGTEFRVNTHSFQGLCVKTSCPTSVCLSSWKGSMKHQLHPSIKGSQGAMETCA